MEKKQKQKKLLCTECSGYFNCQIAANYQKAMQSNKANTTLVTATNVTLAIMCSRFPDFWYTITSDIPKQTLSAQKENALICIQLQYMWHEDNTGYYYVLRDHNFTKFHWFIMIWGSCWWYQNAWKLITNGSQSWHNLLSHADSPITYASKLATKFSMLALKNPPVIYTAHNE